MAAFLAVARGAPAFASARAVDATGAVAAFFATTFLAGATLAGAFFAAVAGAWRAFARGRLHTVGSPNAADCSAFVSMLVVIA